MDILRIVCLGFVQGVLLLGSSTADDDVVPDSATRVKFDFAQRCKVGNNTFVLDESTTLADVIKELGSGVIKRVGKSGEADPEWVVDYTDGHRLIRFSCDSDMGGDNHVLLSVGINEPTVDDKVADLPSLRLPITFQFGSVGMSFSDLVGVLGHAEKTRDVAWYEYSGKRPIKVSSGEVLNYDVLATLKVKVVGGKVAEINLGRVFSY